MCCGVNSRAPLFPRSFPDPVKLQSHADQRGSLGPRIKDWVCLACLLLRPQSDRQPDSKEQPHLTPQRQHLPPRTLERCKVMLKMLLSCFSCHTADKK